eukprot:NODE_521_length_2006_cov_628.376086_g416_i0.p1 GENE.NODE_521_length_2006_cov_628.376086_g416_i0~~NODE_521_length_2006_cov_628.376086_g416_i0.p1  ORF type:complete len:612 (+),score=199.54 NODE_521_length_2006_cov_628.376086_g416_i0:83-1837(+)
MGKRAQERIQEGKSHGSWVLLQNCHLYSDWMPQLEKIIEDYSLRDDIREGLNKDYRLWLTSMPSDKFPVSVLQNGVKMIVEPPRGVKANLLRCYTAAPLNDPKFFTDCTKPKEWKKLLFGLCFFHATVQERRAFGPLGWNIPYSFSDADLRISIRQLQAFLNEYPDIPFDALLYLTGHCNYGGRVTDDKDRRYLLTALGDYYTPDIFDDKYLFSPDGIFSAPKDGQYEQYLEAIQKLPQNANPGVFGLHANADITKDQRDTNLLLDSVLLTQPRDVGSGGGGQDKAQTDPKSIVLQVVQDILEKMPKNFDVEAAEKKYPILRHQSMNTCLTQEMVRYNRLLSRIRTSLKDLEGAIQGTVVMSQVLEALYDAIYDGKIPTHWKSLSYPSTKPLGGYVADLLQRLRFLQDWFEDGPPAVFWLSGFFFTHAFLTGILQNYARKQHFEIDTLRWDFKVLPLKEYAEGPADGCYVHGLFLEGAGWNPERGVLAESKPGELFIPFPIIWLQPTKQSKDSEKMQSELTATASRQASTHYDCPLYRTPERRGVLLTTGHSTNFVMNITLPLGEESAAHWIKRGTALLCGLDY